MNLITQNKVRKVAEKTKKVVKFEKDEKMEKQEKKKEKSGKIKTKVQVQFNAESNTGNGQADLNDLSAFNTKTKKLINNDSTDQ